MLKFYQIVNSLTKYYIDKDIEKQQLYIPGGNIIVLFLK